MTAFLNLSYCHQLCVCHCNLKLLHFNALFFVCLFLVTSCLFHWCHFILYSHHHIINFTHYLGFCFSLFSFIFISFLDTGPATSCYRVLKTWRPTTVQCSLIPSCPTPSKTSVCTFPDTLGCLQLPVCLFLLSWCSHWKVPNICLALKHSHFHTISVC